MHYQWRNKSQKKINFHHEQQLFPPLPVHNQDGRQDLSTGTAFEGLAIKTPGEERLFLQPMLPQDVQAPV